MKKIIYLTLLWVSLSAQAEIYKWVDSQGNTHYGDKPVENASQMDVDIKNKGNIKTSQSRESKRRKLIESFEEDRKREGKEKQKKKDKRKKYARNCLVAKDRLRQYERVRYVYNLDKEGNRVILSDDARKKNTESLRKKIKKYCK